jgi:predicted permease
MGMISKELLLVIPGVFPSLTIALMGVMLGKIDINREVNHKTISNMVYYFLTPCMVFSTLHQRDFDFKEFATIGGAALILIAAMTPIAFSAKRLAKIKENGYCLPIIFMNTGNISLPIALLLFGTEGLAKAIMFHMVNILVLYSFGVYLVSGKSGIGQFLRIPALYATVLGILVAKVSLPLPPLVQDVCSIAERGIDVMALAAIPLLIVDLGYSMSQADLSQLRNGFTGAYLRVLLGPVLALALIYCGRLLGLLPIGPGLDPSTALWYRTTEAIIVLNAAMPGPIMAYLLNVKFDNCPKQAASMLMVGTLAGIVTVPCFLYVIKHFILTG